MKFVEIPKVTSALKKAKAMSKLSDHPDYKIGAVIVRQGIIISAACNTGTKSHTYIKKNGKDFNKTLHAEINAIFKVKNKDILKGATIVTYREKKDGTLGMSRPCPMCYELIKKFGIKKIQYTIDDGIKEETVVYEFE